MKRLPERGKVSRKQLITFSLGLVALLWLGCLYVLLPNKPTQTLGVEDTLQQHVENSEDSHSILHQNTEYPTNLEHSVEYTAKGLHIIVQFPVLDESLDESDAATRTNRLHRQMEYTEALMANLMHPAVECVHVLLERNEDQPFLTQQLLAYPYAYHFVELLPPAEQEEGASLSPAERLWRYVEAKGRIKFVQLGRWMFYSDAFAYARQELPGRVCIIQNSDISLSLLPNHVVAYQRLRDHALFTSPARIPKLFVLSRSEPVLPSCPKRRPLSCSQSAAKGSYDSFVFLSPLPELVEWQVPMPQNIWGAENRVIWTLKCLNLSVTNPCHELVTVHHHCHSRFRPTQQTDPVGLPQVKYDNVGPYAFPPRRAAPSMETSMAASDFPTNEFCRAHPWNGPPAAAGSTLG